MLSRPTPRQKSLLEQIVGGRRRGRHDDRHRPRPAARRLRRRPGQGLRDPARRRRPRRHAGGPQVPGRTCSPGVCSGPARASSGRCGRSPRLQRSRPAPTTPSPAGPTPRCIERHGEAYRAGLHRLGAELGVAHAVDYQSAYLDDAALGALIRSADVVVLPYDSRRAGHLRRPGRGGGGRGPGGRHAVPARRRAAHRRARPARAAPESRRAGHGDPRGSSPSPGLAAGARRPVTPARHLRWPAVADRYQRLRRTAHRRAVARGRRASARRRDRQAAPVAAQRARHGARRAELHAPGPADRRHRAVRARPARHGPPRARLLHRRRRPRPGRHQPRAGPVADGAPARRVLPGLPRPTRRTPRGAFHNRLGLRPALDRRARPRRLVGPGAVGPGHRRRPEPRPVDPRGGAGRLHPGRRPPLAGPARHGLRRARRRRGAARRPGQRRRRAALLADAAARGRAARLRTRGGRGRSSG